MAPQPPRAHSQKDLPPSVETAYYRKCIDLRRRITDIDDSNDATRHRILRLNRGLQKMRLERAFLLDLLNKHMEYNDGESEGSTSAPATPTDKPLRSKRGQVMMMQQNQRKETPTGDGVVGGGAAGGAGVSSAMSTPDPARGVQGGNYFSPHGAVNGSAAGAQVLPPLHALPGLQASRGYYDPAADEGGEERRRAYGGAQGQGQNGDTEMGDGGFGAQGV